MTNHRGQVVAAAQTVDEAFEPDPADLVKSPAGQQWLLESLERAGRQSLAITDAATVAQLAEALWGEP
jgi:hypothetical protein